MMYMFSTERCNPNGLRGFQTVAVSTERCIPTGCMRCNPLGLLLLVGKTQRKFYVHPVGMLLSVGKTQRKFYRHPVGMHLSVEKHASNNCDHYEF